MGYIFNKSINEIIKERHAVRSYENSELSNEIKEKLEKYLEEINNTKGIFGRNIRIKLIQNNENGAEMKLGTYGVIRGARYYLAVACKREEYALEDLGFLFERVILYCTSLGLGTVWLGGTFNKGNFGKAINLQNGEVLSIVSPIGEESDKKSLLAKMFGNNTNKRKLFGEVFFNQNFETPLTIQDAKEYAEVLEMIRLAPSAMNMQPWRILKEDNNYHIYTNSKIEMAKVDIGICLCHFDLVTKEKGLDGEFKVLENKTHDKYKYVISWVQK